MAATTSEEYPPMRACEHVSRFLEISTSGVVCREGGVESEWTLLSSQHGRGGVRSPRSVPPINVAELAAGCRELLTHLHLRLEADGRASRIPHNVFMAIRSD